MSAPALDSYGHITDPNFHVVVIRPTRSYCTRCEWRQGGGAERRDLAPVNEHLHSGGRYGVLVVDGTPELS